MDNSREGAILGGTGLCMGITAAMWLPMPTLGIPVLGVVATVAGLGLAAATGWRIQDRIPQRLNSIQNVQYARVYRL